jgi:hypothetical protein
VMNHQTGETCEINFKPRRWRKGADDQSVNAVVKDRNGDEKYQITGKYTTSLFAKNL